MTHINSRDYVDSGRTNVSDSSENEVRPGDGIFAGIFSSIGEKNKSDIKNDRSSNETIVKSDLADGDVPITNLGELGKDQENQSTSDQESKVTPSEHNEKGDIVSNKFTKSTEEYEGERETFFSLDRDKIDEPRIKDSSKSETSNLPRKNWTPEGKILQKASPMPKSISASTNSTKLKNGQPQIIEPGGAELDKSNETKTKRASADKLHVK